MVTSPDSTAYHADAVRDRDDSTEFADIFRTLSHRVRAGTRMYNVLVFGEGQLKPLRRIRVNVEDSTHIPATATALAQALNQRAIEFTAEHDPQVPRNELWVTFTDRDTAVINIP
jgi:hypothetical protein